MLSQSRVAPPHGAFKAKESHQLYHCIAVYSVERISAVPCNSAGIEEEGSPEVEFGLAAIEVGGPGKSGDWSTPFAMAARDMLRKLLLGNLIVYVPVAHRAGHVYVVTEGSGAHDLDVHALVSAQLVKHGLATVRSAGHALPLQQQHPQMQQQQQQQPDRRRQHLADVEEQAKKRGVGIHGIGRLSEATATVRTFPGDDHSLRSVMVQHLVNSTVKATIERVHSLCSLDAVLVPSLLAVKLRLAGLLLPTDEAFFDECREALRRAVLHRTVTVTVHRFDRATSTFWCTVLSPPVAEMLVDAGIVMVDYRSVAQSTRCLDLCTAEDKARERQRGVWANRVSDQPSGRALAAAPAGATNPTREVEVCVNGIVVAVFDELTIAVVPVDGEVTPAAEHDRREQHPTVLCVVRIGFLGSPDPQVHSKLTSSGNIVRYTAKSYFGREALRTMCIGVRVTLFGVEAQSLPFPPVLPSTSAKARFVIGRVAIYDSGLDVAVSLLQLPRLFHVTPLGANSGVAFSEVPHELVQHLLDVRQAPLLKKQNLATVEARGVTASLSEVEEGPAAVPVASFMDVLYAETEAQIERVLRGGRLPLGVPVPAVVESTRVDPVALSCFLPCLGITIEVSLCGIRTPATSLGSGDASAVQRFLRELENFFLCEVLHRNVILCILRAAAEPSPGGGGGGGGGGSRMKLLATVRNVEGCSLALQLVKCGLALPSSLLHDVPLAPSLQFVAAYRVAQCEAAGIWSRPHRKLRDAVVQDISRRTHLTLGSDCGGQSAGITIVPLAWKDHRTFTYRCVSDEADYADIKKLVAASRPPKKSHVHRVGDVVAAPFGDDYFRAVLISVDEGADGDDAMNARPEGNHKDGGTRERHWNVTFLDYGTSATRVPESALKVHYKSGGINSLAKWPALAHTARHAFIAFPVAPAPLSGGISSHSSGHRKLRANNPRLPREVYELLLEKMKLLVSFESLQLYKMYEKDGFDHVVIMPPGVGLDETHSVVSFAESLWQEVDAVQRALSSQATESTEADGGGGRPMLTVEPGCSEFPELTQWVARFYPAD